MNLEAINAAVTSATSDQARVKIDHAAGPRYGLPLRHAGILVSDQITAAARDAARPGCEGPTAFAIFQLLTGLRPRGVA